MGVPFEFWRAVFFGLALLGASGCLLAQEPLIETMTVKRFSVDVRAVDATGKPLQGLTAEDFLLEIDGQPHEVDRAQWIDLRRLEAVAQEEEDADFIDEMGPLPGEDGGATAKYILLFFQGSINPERTYGLVRAANFSKQLIAQLPDDAYTAVFAFHSHLQLKCDFTQDRDMLLDAVDQSMKNHSEVVFRAGNYPSLDAYFSDRRGREIASVEAALYEVATVAGEFPGAKNLVFVGWGVGQLTNGPGVTQATMYQDAVAALHRARISVFALDLSMADYHSLETGMKHIARQTGGSYQSLFRFPKSAINHTVMLMAGYYVVSYRVELKSGRQPKHVLKLRHVDGELYMRPAYQ